MEVFETSEGVGAVRRGIPDSRWHLCCTVHFYVCKGAMMKEILSIIAYPAVFLFGFFLSAAFALDDIKRLRGQIKALQGEINKIKRYANDPNV